jgi:phosphoribosylformylglycinamidine synthase PurS subunit
MRWNALVEVRLLPGIADPAGTTIERSLPTLGFDHITAVRTGKAIRFAVEADDESAALATVEDLCRRFLTNPVIEDAAITLEAATR